MRCGVALLALACLLGTTSALAARPGCVCAAVYDPVCGQDGSDYSNACQADCAGITVAHKGSCTASSGLELPGASGSSSTADDCLCTKLYNPVCGEDGETYPNECQATCAGASVSYDGKCKAAGSKTVSAVTQEDSPKATAAAADTPAADAVELPATAPSEQPAAGQELTSSMPTSSTAKSKSGTPQTLDCVCAAVYQPVCGADGKTYPNACEADCKGIEIVTDADCAATDASSSSSTTAPVTVTTPDSSSAVRAAEAPSKLTPTAETPAEGTPTAESPDAEPAAEETPVELSLPSSGGTASGPKQGCVCAAVFEPVCGNDGKDYSNACEADCAGATVLRKGRCSSSSLPGGSSDGSSCVCPMVYAPVCTKKGATRSNQCMAECRGEKVAHEGPCKSKATVITEEATNAGSTDSTNATAETPATAKEEAITAEQTTATAKGDCSTPCANDKEPVCGADGTTYDNSCAAKCTGKTAVAHTGACGSDSAPSPPKGNGAVARSLVLPAVLAVLCFLGMLL